MRATSPSRHYKTLRKMHSDGCYTKHTDIRTIHKHTGADSPLPRTNMGYTGVGDMDV